jgi:glutaredoxin 3
MAKVDIYTTTYCPYCVKAKNLLNLKGIAYTEHDVTDNTAARDELVIKAEGRRTVPQIFINDKPIGGCDDLYALNDAGKLEDLLSQ